ncbi:MAG: UDP-glucose 4-epimerase GalE [Halobacteriovoraceae bacterium]|nr:UDP-glucose 4-epimerase GalE [Halobacteriovoraceae bacterium]
MSDKILVTGGAGYIGSHVIKLLNKQNYEIVILDNLSTGRKESVLSGKLIVGDICDNKLVSEIIKKNNIKSVLHFAGSIIVPESVTNPIKYYQNNTIKSFELIKTCVENDVKNFIFSSTAAVYGIPEVAEVDESTPLDPINPYGRSKLMTEWALEDISRANHAFNYVALRYFNVAGADIDNQLGQCTPITTHLIKTVAELIVGKRDKMFIFGDDYETRDGTCIRDYIHVLDLAQAHLDALTYLNNGGQSDVFNCGYGQGHTVKEVTDKMKEMYGSGLNILIDKRREGDPPCLIAKSEKIKKTFGWTPKYNDLNIILKTAVDWEKKINEQNK